MNVKYLAFYLLPVATLISLSILPPLSTGCGGDSGCPDLDDLGKRIVSSFLHSSDHGRHHQSSTTANAT